MVLKIKEVAERLNCSTDSAYALIYSGKLSAVNISGKPGATRAAWRVPVKALEQFLAEQAVRR